MTAAQQHRRAPTASDIKRVRDLLPMSWGNMPPEAVRRGQYDRAAELLDAMLASPDQGATPASLRAPVGADIERVHQLLLCTEPASVYATPNQDWLCVVAAALTMRLQGAVE